MDSTDNAPPTISPSGLTEEDTEVLALFGNHITYRMRLTMGELTVYGAYFILVVMALYTISKRQARSARTLALVAALALTFSITTVIFGLDVFSIQDFVKTVFLRNTDLTLLDRALLYGNKHPFDLVQIWLGNSADAGLLFIVNDVLASWRAAAFYRSTARPIVLTLLYSLVFSSFAIWISYASLETYRWNIDYQATHENSNTPSILLFTASAASIAANLLATGLIGYTTYKSNKLQASSGMKMRSSQVLVFLTESGAFYAVLQIVRLALSVSVVPSTPAYGSLDTAFAVFQSSTQFITAMYTPALIIIINYGYSIADQVVEGDLSATDAESGGEKKERKRRLDGTISEIVFHPQTLQSQDERLDSIAGLHRDDSSQPTLDISIVSRKNSRDMAS